jgi:hypothetical protein
MEARRIYNHGPGPLVVLEPTRNGNKFRFILEAGDSCIVSSEATVHHEDVRNPGKMEFIETH